MTYQIADTLVYEDDDYELIGDNTHKLPMLERYGIVPSFFETSCYRAYVARYIIKESELYLTELMVRDSNGIYPAIGGVKYKKHLRGVPLYEDLQEKMDITGQIVIGKDLVSYAEIRLPHDFETVKRLHIKSGELVTVEDISKEAAILTEQIKQIRSERRKIEDFDERMKHRVEEQLELIELSRRLASDTNSEENFDNS